MTIVAIVLALLLGLETLVIFTAIHGPAIDSKSELIENNWSEFLAWIQDAREIKSLVPPYETWTEAIDGTAHYVGLANESNFWLWYLDYKWEKPRAATKAGSVK